MEFSASILVDAIETYFKADRHMKERGYSAPVYKIKMNALDKITKQTKAYKATLNQQSLKLKTV